MERRGRRGEGRETPMQSKNFLRIMPVVYLIMPNTHHRRKRRTQFATSSRRLPTDSFENLDTGQTDSIGLAFELITPILIDIDNFFNNDDIMTSLLKKLSISIKIGVIKRYRVCLASFQILDRIRRQSS